MTPMISRRTALATAAVLVAAAAGTGIGALRAPRRRPPAPPPTPAWLVEATSREQALLTAIGSADRSDALVQVVRADHVEHLRTLQAMSPVEAGASGSGSGSGSSAPESPAVRPSSDLRRAELDAAAAAAAASAQLTGADAALIASISACEASHADLLT